LTREYGELKLRLARAHANDRVANTQAENESINRVTETAKRHYGESEEAGSL